MNGFRVEVETARAMADLHDEAAAAVTDLASCQPSGLDGGVGGPYVLRILAAVSRDAGRVAQLNTSVAARVRTAVDTIQGFDASAAKAFRELGKGMP